MKRPTSHSLTSEELEDKHDHDNHEHDHDHSQDHHAHKKHVPDDFCRNCGTGWWRANFDRPPTSPGESSSTTSDSNSSSSSSNDTTLPATAPSVIPPSVICSGCRQVSYCSEGCRKAQEQKHLGRCGQFTRKTLSFQLREDMHAVAFYLKECSRKAYAPPEDTNLGVGSSSSSSSSDSNSTSTSTSTSINNCNISSAKEDDAVLNNVITLQILPRLIATRAKSADALKVVMKDSYTVLPHCQKLLKSMFDAWQQLLANEESVALSDVQLEAHLQQYVEDEHMVASFTVKKSCALAERITEGRFGQLEETVRERVMQCGLDSLVAQLNHMTNVERDSFMFKLMFADGLANTLAAMREAGVLQAMQRNDPFFASAIGGHGDVDGGGGGVGACGDNKQSVDGGQDEGGISTSAAAAAAAETEINTCILSSGDLDEIGVLLDDTKSSNDTTPTNAAVEWSTSVRSSTDNNKESNSLPTSSTAAIITQSPPVSKLTVAPTPSKPDIVATVVEEIASAASGDGDRRMASKSRFRFLRKGQTNKDNATSGTDNSITLEKATKQHTGLFDRMRKALS